MRETEQEDREKWIVSGRVSGRALVAAVATELDRLEPRLREELDSLVG